MSGICQNCGKEAELFDYCLFTHYIGDMKPHRTGIQWPGTCQECLRFEASDPEYSDYEYVKAGQLPKKLKKQFE